MCFRDAADFGMLCRIRPDLHMLTIAIPTYGRNETLAKTIAGLLPQLGGDCRLLILDNCSPVPVVETLAPVLAQWPQVRYQIIRHRVNLGGTANILRCFELCETEWIWTLGDDDVVCADALATIRRTISEHSGANYVSFLTEGGVKSGYRKHSIVTHGVTEFVEKVDAVHGINFMSCSLWNAPAFVGAMKQAYQYGYSMGWSIALLLFSLGEEGGAVLSCRAIIAEASVAPIELRWSYREFIIGWPLLLEVPLHESIRRVFACKMLTLHSPENVVAYLLGVPGVDARERLFYYKLAASRVSLYNAHLLGRFRFLAYRPLFWAPAWGWKLVRLSIRAANRLGLKQIDIADIEGRQSVSQ